MNTQFRKGVLEICVLTLISKKDMYGYEIVQNISKVIEVNEGTIYPILRRLTIESLNRLKSEWNEFVYAVNTFLND